MDKITEMASYFVESSDMGKLYLNYPMVEAYYHMKSIPDPEFDSYTVSLEELTTIENLKRTLETLNYLTKHGISIYEELSERCDETAALQL